MKGLDLKLVTFYSGSLVAVIALFSAVTRYGEANLKPPSDIGGTYPISASLPLDCASNPDLALVIQQSGVYLHAALASAPTQESTPEATLQGRWDGNHLTLEGTVPHSALCRSEAQPSKNSAPINPVVAVEADLRNTTLDGTLTINAEPPVAFSTSLASPAATISPGAH
jgi:hypothetical protein